jgi:hypothetical protein
LASARFQDINEQRVESPEQNHPGGRGQNPVIKQQGAFARYRLEQTAADKARPAQGVKCERPTNGDTQQDQDEDPAFRVGGKGVDRGQHTGTHQKCSKQGQAKGDNGKKDGPAFQRVAFFHHNGRV